MRTRTRWWLAVGVPVALAGLAAVVRAVPDVAPDADFAVFDIHILNVLHGWQPTGPYSRFGWSHPGPLAAWLLAPLYLLSGYRHLSTLVMAVVLNGVCLFGVLAVLRKHAGLGLLLTTALALGVYVVRAWGLVASPWNPHLPILAFALLLAAGAAAASGAYALLPLVVGLASYAMQTHIGFALAAIVVTAVTLALIAIDRWRLRREAAPASRALARALVASVVVAAIAWALPLIDELRPGGQHNLRSILAFFQTQEPGNPRVLGRIFASNFVAPFSRDLSPPWGGATWPESDPPIQVLAEVEGALLVVCAVWAFRRQRFERRLALLTLAASIAAFVSIRQLPPHPNAHAAYWVSILGVMIWALVGAVPVRLALTRWAPGLRSLPRAAAWSLGIAGIVSLGVIGTRQIAQRHRLFQFESRGIYALERLVRAHLDRSGTVTPLVHVSQDTWTRVAGVVLQLYRAGLRPTVDPEWLFMFGASLRPTGREPVELRFALREEHLENYQHRSDHDLVGTVRDTAVYEAHPPPAAAPIADRLEIIGATGSAALLDPERLVDGRWLPDRDGQLPPMTIFDRVASSVTFRLPPRDLSGVRIWGQQAVIWQLSCSKDGVTFERIGRVRTPDSSVPVPGDVHLRALSECRQLRIAPFDNNGAWALSEVQLLARTPAPSGR